MKYAMIVARSRDRRRAKTVAPMAPFADQLAEFKRRVSENDCPNPDLPLMELWTDNSGVTKSHLFRVRAPQGGAPELDDAGDPLPEPGYADMKVAELRAEIARRNAERADGDMIDVGSRAKHADLVAALEADDASRGDVEDRVSAGLAGAVEDSE